VERTAVDLAACLSRRHLEVVVDELIASGRCQVKTIREVLDSVARRGRSGVANMRTVLDERSEDLENATPLERDGFRLLIEAGLFGFVTEFAIPWKPDRRFDVAFPDHRVAVEWDSRRWHTQKAAFQKDRERDREAHEHGWRVLRFTWSDVQNAPFDVIDSIQSVIEG